MPWLPFFTIAIWTSQAQKYILNETYSGDTFFDKFEFLQDQQCVESSYTNFLINASQGFQSGYLSTANNTIYIGTDYSSTLPPSSKGRPGICIGTKRRYNNGLFILNASHMPFGCGVWPSWWQTDGTWYPNTCEIDTIEGINLFTDDRTTVHTYSPCNMSSQVNKVNISGKWDLTNCDDQENGGSGCTIEPLMSTSYGKGFNDNGGGVYAHENNPNLGSVRVWFWTQDKVPQDIGKKEPDPSKWGIPYAEYPFGEWCPAEIFNTAKQLRFDIYFCGWSGQEEPWKEQCQNSVANGKSCEEFVAGNPEYFKDAYWLINYMDVYQLS